jgi:hypothetical protein
VADPQADVERLLEEADSLRDGPAKVAILEQAVAIADTHQNVQLGYQARKKLLPACLDSGLPDLMLVAYSWCLAQCDRDPTQFELQEILWEYRWVVSEMPTFPTISLHQIQEGLADITRRYQAAGSTLRPIHLLKVNVGLSLKDRLQATEALEAWRKSARDYLSDDEETERAFVADYYFFMEQYEEAFQACAGVIRGRMKSEHFFGSDCADLLYPLWKSGRREDAENCHKRGYRYVAWNPRYVDCCGDHVEYLALVNNWGRAARLVEKHLPVALESHKPNDRMAFLRSMYVFLRRYQRTGPQELSLNLPKEVPGRQSNGKYALDELARWLHADVAEMSAKYDARNGNDWYARRLARSEADILAPLDS